MDAHYTMDMETDGKYIPPFLSGSVLSSHDPICLHVNKAVPSNRRGGLEVRA